MMYVGTAAGPNSRTARAAGRASALARAYAVGDRATLARAGLNYGDLQALGSIVAIGVTGLGGVSGTPWPWR